MVMPVLNRDGILDIDVVSHVLVGMLSLTDISDEFSKWLISSFPALLPFSCPYQIDRDIPHAKERVNSVFLL